MKTLKLNPVTGSHSKTLIRKSDSNEYQYSTQTIDWWINNEVPFFISQGYKIQIGFQYYDVKTGMFK